MKIHKEGYTSLLVTILFVAAVVVAINIVFPEQGIGHYIVYGILGLLFLIVLQFFRSPNRAIVVQPDTVLCPADGKVVVIEKTYEDECLKEERIQVSIFMSPVNVHVNRYPLSGIVSFYKYHPGKFLVAWHPKSSTENERTTVVVKNSTYGEVLFRQIAGALARRIVCYSRQGHEVTQGSEFGFIKFGSRVDLFLPLNAEINVKIGDKVKGGQTIIARLKA